MPIDLETLDIAQLGALTTTGYGSLPIVNTVSVSGALNLFLKGSVPVASSGSLNLSMTGSTSGTSYELNQLPLFLKADPTNSSINLFIEGERKLTSKQSFMNMYIAGYGTMVDNSLPAVIFGGYGGGFPHSNNISLFLEGDGLSENHIPLTASMNMFLQTASGSNNSINLFMQADQPNENAIDLYTYGVTGSSSGILNLYTLSKDNMNSHISLFTRGY
jgi:hypothetical protein